MKADATSPPFACDGSAGEGSGLVHCARCSHEVPARNQCSNCGAFLSGNGAAVIHGLHRYQATGMLPPAVTEPIDEFREALVSARGGVIEMERHPLRAALVRVAVDCEVAR
jgi:hypothetical protein